MTFSASLPGIYMLEREIRAIAFLLYLVTLQLDEGIQVDQSVVVYNCHCLDQQ